MLQSDWPRPFWPIPQEFSDFSKVWDKCKNTANNMNVLYRPNSEKIINFPINLKNPTFGLFSPFLGQKKLFLNLALSHTTTHRPLTPS